MDIKLKLLYMWTLIMVWNMCHGECLEFNSYCFVFDRR